MPGAVRRYRAGLTRHPGTEEPLAEGERVLLLERKGRRYLQTLRAGATFHFHGGHLARDQLMDAAGGPPRCARAPADAARAAADGS